MNVDKQYRITGIDKTVAPWSGETGASVAGVFVMQPDWLDGTFDSIDAVRDAMNEIAPLEHWTYYGDGMYTTDRIEDPDGDPDPDGCWLADYTIEVCVVIAHPIDMACVNKKQEIGGAKNDE